MTSEPMVRDAAVWYWVPDLQANGDDPLAVNADKLLKLEPDPRVPFMVGTSTGRPPFKCMDDTSWASGRASSGTTSTSAR